MAFGSERFVHGRAAWFLVALGAIGLPAACAEGDLQDPPTTTGGSGGTAADAGKHTTSGGGSGSTGASVTGNGSNGGNPTNTTSGSTGSTANGSSTSSTGNGTTGNVASTGANTGSTTGSGATTGATTGRTTGGATTGATTGRTTGGATTGVTTGATTGTTGGASTSSATGGDTTGDTTGGTDGGSDGGSVPCTSCTLKIRASVSNPADTNVIWTQVLVALNGSTDVPLTDVTIRYWFSESTASDMTVDCDYWGLGAGNGCPLLRHTVAAAPSPTAAADHYIELSFTRPDGGTAPMVSTITMPMQLRIHRPGYQAISKNDDYSYDANATALTDNDHITAYVRGKLAWGTEP